MKPGCVALNDSNYSPQLQKKTGFGQISAWVGHAACGILNGMVYKDEILYSLDLFQSSFVALSLRIH